MPGDGAILTSRGVADLLGISISTAQLWMESGILPSWKTPGGHRRAYAGAVLRCQQGGGAPTPADAAALQRPAWTDADEALRQQALARSGLLATPASVQFDRLTWLAAQLTQAPIALITLLTPSLQWFKSRHGLAVLETPRAWAFCNHTITQDDVFSVSDAAADPRFCDNALVTGAPHMRFYAGVPLTDADGVRLGALCVIDTEPRLLTRQQTRGLRELGAIACAEVARARPQQQ